MFQNAPFGGAGDLGATDFTVDIPFLGDAAGGLTGIERDVDATTNKATLSPDVNLASPTARQFACVFEGVPSVIFDNQQALRALLSTEMSRRLSEEFDSHVVSKIEAAAPPTGGSGSDLVARIRNAISEARDLGCDPTVLALTPSDSAGLDLIQDGAGNYVFLVRVEGSGSPVWGLVVREVPSISAPTLISPSQLGLTYLGGSTILVDPYTGMKTNQVRVRVEAEGTFHVRNIKQGAFVVA